MRYLPAATGGCQMVEDSNGVILPTDVTLQKCLRCFPSMNRLCMLRRSPLPWYGSGQNRPATANWSAHGQRAAIERTYPVRTRQSHEKLTLSRNIVTCNSSSSIIQRNIHHLDGKSASVNKQSGIF